MLIGYARGRRGEDPGQQLIKLDDAGCEQIYCDPDTTVKGPLPQQERALQTVSRGDTLVVCKFIHIGRSVQHLTDTLAQLHQRGVAFRSIDDNLNTGGPDGEQIIAILYAYIELRREWASDSTKEGLDEAVQNGHNLGRRPSLSPQQTELANLLAADGRHTIVQIADLLGVSRATMYSYLTRSQHDREG